MNFMFSFTIIFNQGDVEKDMNITIFSRKINKSRDIRRIAWVDINSPFIPNNSENLVSYMFPYTNFFG